MANDRLRIKFFMTFSFGSGFCFVNKANIEGEEKKGKGTDPLPVGKCPQFENALCQISLGGWVGSTVMLDGHTT